MKGRRRDNERLCQSELARVRKDRGEGEEEEERGGTWVSESCTSCASTNCVKLASSGAIQPGGGNKGSTNVGAIAGGVIGGVAVIAIVTYLVWRCWIKRRREEYQASLAAEDDFPAEKGNDSFVARRDPRASTHTVTSMASSAFTRASNIIQIAYIPGVTNRGPHSPELLVPPVPPIPAVGSEAGSPYSPHDQHFFVPGDLRNSTFSTDSVAGRGSGRHRTSIAPSLARSSVATTIYRDNAVIDPMPAQTVVRGKAAVVSVKSSQNNSPTDSPGGATPPMPRDQAYAAGSPSRGLGVQTRGSSDNLGASEKPNPLNIIKASPKNGRSSPVGLPGRNVAPASGYNHDDRAKSPQSFRTNNRSAARDSDITEIQDTPGSMQSPFADSQSRQRSTPSPYLDSDTSTLRATSPALSSVRSASPRDFGNAGPGGLAVVIEEATRRASRVPAAGLGSRVREQSPFEDGDIGGHR